MSSTNFFECGCSITRNMFEPYEVLSAFVCYKHLKEYPRELEKTVEFILKIHERIQKYFHGRKTNSAKIFV